MVVLVVLVVLKEALTILACGQFHTLDYLLSSGLASWSAARVKYLIWTTPRLSSHAQRA